MKKLLVAVLAISTIIEIYLGFATLLTPEMMTVDFGIATLTPEISYLAAIIGWFCLLASGFAAAATFWIYKDRSEGYQLAIALGIFWLGLGLHLGFGFGRSQHLILDAAKGAVILILCFLTCRRCEKAKPN